MNLIVNIVKNNSSRGTTTPLHNYNQGLLHKEITEKKKTQ